MVGFQARKAVLRRGGARNRADRQSWQLTERNCSDLIAAAGTAWAAGKPFNRFATVAFGKTGIDARDCVAATGDWIKLAREWFAANGQPMPWAWVQEWGPIYLAHCHTASGWQCGRAGKSGAAKAGTGWSSFDRCMFPHVPNRQVD